MPADNKKTKVVAVRVTPETYQAAAAEAKKQHRSLPKVIQAFLYLFGQGETPPDWPPDVPEATQRASENRRRKKRGQKEAQDDPDTL
jgi:hypothetical protein